MKFKHLVLLFSGIYFLNSCENKINTVASQSSKFVFQVDFPFPTADKPQSKLWFMENSWWAILPLATGPSLWQRTEDGWKEHKEINLTLRGIPGRADVWSEENEITAVGVSRDSLIVFSLKKMEQKWESRIIASLYPPDKSNEIETATIARDNTGRFWVAADAGNKVCVWGSNNDGIWEGPFILSEGIDEDDICTITTIPEGVGVIWSDQMQEAVKMRVHRDGRLLADWDETEIIEKGNKTADDHLNTALSADGTLWLTTKNSVDLEGQPQFILRVRSPHGHWVNYPYCNLNVIRHPSRPIILTTDEYPLLVLSGHTIYNRSNPYLGEIEFGIIDTTDTGILRQVTTVIAPDTTGWTDANFINDATGPKDPFPGNAPWIVLASDRDGRVYEADLALFFNPQ